MLSDWNGEPKGVIQITDVTVLPFDKGIRAAVAHDMFTAEMVKRHNNANILAMGGRVVSPELAKDMTRKWLDTEFEGGRHTNRINKISAIEEKYFK